MSVTLPQARHCYTLSEPCHWPLAKKADAVLVPHLQQMLDLSALRRHGYGFLTKPCLHPSFHHWQLRKNTDTMPMPHLQLSLDPAGP